MDVRTLNHAKGIRQLSDIDQHETDTDRLNKICEPLLNSLEGVCAEIKKKGVRIDCTPQPTSAPATRSR